jgi:hypothetical protein
MQWLCYSIELHWTRRHPMQFRSHQAKPRPDSRPRSNPSSVSDRSPIRGKIWEGLRWKAWSNMEWGKLLKKKRGKTKRNEKRFTTFDQTDNKKIHFWLRFHFCFSTSSDNFFLLSHDVSFKKTFGNLSKKHLNLIAFYFNPNTSSDFKIMYYMKDVKKLHEIEYSWQYFICLVVYFIISQKFKQ